MSQPSQPDRSPAELRNMFGANLRQLARDYPSISELSRRLGINRTQFNRYLTGESFPRPDVLDRICNFFDVDARILLDPVAQLSCKGRILQGAFLNDFLGPGVTNMTEAFFPSGLYQFLRRSFVRTDRYILGLVRVFRSEGITYIRGYEAKSAMRYQGLPADAKSREFRGYASAYDDGVAFTLARRGGRTSSFNYLANVPAMEANVWAGYVARTSRESDTADRVTRMVYEYLGQNHGVILRTARRAGFVEQHELSPFQQRLLGVGTRFR
ncbi:helix-turn-helix domain-containing protein [Phaeobacter inhibens]|uniref:helix-turn-helix domain-containing protein n=1 Tax=Phaeobacter inhibens TaxID=221822 RepID=UPI0009ECB547|nr:helix-turn-helix transcriptional regulator [Phaeobacter inhibens]WHP69896.1 helix-turn-helix transcriptional regulator [Phaeobacter inhibens]